ncbi:hypothetical protein H696_02542 [Fonticula alba]|uniref:TNFR-Cys domain-containing protein n=1 Tax=Fonticula alba TaxID=691883 RepID=A0A058ZB24_FONAL|nr:hypothetical protein H696_02542 [Fonticula alba]KCV71599.1 hypothetical protein H696_02542 [Fonticula alba]|eukprot:XP_009494722.1 hypothetical protein H696_02542 [Fonticula alba]
MAVTARRVPGPGPAPEARSSSLRMCLVLMLVGALLQGIRPLGGWAEAAIAGDYDADMPPLLAMASPYGSVSVAGLSFERLYPTEPPVQIHLQNTGCQFHGPAMQEDLFFDRRLGSFFSKTPSGKVVLADIPLEASPSMLAMAAPSGGEPLFAWLSGKVMGFSWHADTIQHTFAEGQDPSLLAASATGPSAGRALVKHGNTISLMVLVPGEIQKSGMAIDTTGAVAGLPGHFFLATATGWTWLLPNGTLIPTPLNEAVLRLAATRYLTADPDRVDLVVVTASRLLIYLGLGDDGTWQSVLTNFQPTSRNNLNLSLVPRVSLATLPTGYLYLHQGTSALWRVVYHPTRLLWQRVLGPSSMTLTGMGLVPVHGASAPGQPPEQWRLAVGMRTFTPGELLGCAGADPSIACHPTEAKWECAPGRVYSPLTSSAELCAGCADGYYRAPLPKQQYRCLPCPGAGCRACVAGVCVACAEGYLLERSAHGGGPPVTRCVSDCSPGFQAEGAVCRPATMPPVAVAFTKLPSLANGQTILSLTRSRAYAQGDQLYVSNASLEAPEPGALLVMLSDRSLGFLDMDQLLASPTSGPVSVTGISGSFFPVSSSTSLLELGPVVLPQGEVRLALVSMHGGQILAVVFQCVLSGSGPADECQLQVQSTSGPANISGTNPPRRLSPTVLAVGNQHFELNAAGSLVTVTDPDTSSSDIPSMGTHVDRLTGLPASWVYRMSGSQLIAQPWALLRVGDSRLKTADGLLIKPINPLPAEGMSPASGSTCLWGCPEAGRPAGASAPDAEGHADGGRTVRSRASGTGSFSFEPTGSWRPVYLDAGAARRSGPLPPGDVLVTGVLSHGGTWHWGVVNYSLGLEPQGRTRAIAGTSELLAPVGPLAGVTGNAPFHAVALRLAGLPEYPSALVVLHPAFLGVMLLHCPVGELACRPGPRHISPYPADLEQTGHESLGVEQLVGQPSRLPSGRPASINLLLVYRGLPATSFLVQMAIDSCPSGTYGPLCLACHGSCQTCTGPDAGDCVLPKCTAFLPSAPGVCLSACPAGLVADATGACLCHGSCAACASADGVGPFICTACPSGMAVAPAGEQQAGQCVSCHASCRECSAPGSAGACTGCLGSGMFLQPGGMCSGAVDCPAGTWPDGSMDECVACPTGCSACRDAVKCSACEAGFLFESVMQVCLPCAPECTACVGVPDNCLACRTGYRWEDGAPPTGTPPAGKCIFCGPSCASCQDDGQCLACTNGKLLTPAGTCTATCPSGTGPVAGGAVCGPCHDTCSLCTMAGVADSCVACVQGGLLLRHTEGASCVENCPNK